MGNIFTHAERRGRRWLRANAGVSTKLDAPRHIAEMIAPPKPYAGPWLAQGRTYKAIHSPRLPHQGKKETRRRAMKAAGF